ncbi:uncharacterized protein B0I36DRAFT_326381 [Microdochium trichocladiopsis]|uniref:DNA2/NAM7 helicase-like C-terminal domain-containing protein n=1 Tax=Microdochium trichocladiopsis TaxID=1682393 RepID=A0A9P8Y4Y3_9PEZI|nr:uncharacterized protein B0I36DRAFT_326381 [Microdochium trichocladiopsis]KAH7029808.1 hypothetical protein B0I36DRAFT_326381 [Microdochium trichocladiopsis]
MFRSAGKPGFLSPFGAYSHVSEIDRQIASPSFTVSHLANNWRQHFGLGVFSSQNFYDDGNRQGHHRAPKHARRIREFVQKLTGNPDTSGARVMYDMKGSLQGEQMTSTSYKNTAQCAYAAHVIVQLHNSGITVKGHVPHVLVMAPYSAQVDEMNRQLHRLSPSEYCAQAVDVRTIPDSMSEAADLAIVLWTRTNSTGFTNQADIVNVATTRGRYAEIHVIDSSIFYRGFGRDDHVNRRAYLHRLYIQCQEQKACFFGGEREWMLCRRCFKPEHRYCGAFGCQHCRTVGHHLRNCHRKDQHKPLPYVVAQANEPTAPGKAEEEDLMWW